MNRWLKNDNCPFSLKKNKAGLNGRGKLQSVSSTMSVGELGYFSNLEDVEDKRSTEQRSEDQRRWPPNYDTHTDTHIITHIITH